MKVIALIISLGSEYVNMCVILSQGNKGFIPARGRKTDYIINMALLYITNLCS